MAKIIIKQGRDWLQANFRKFDVATGRQLAAAVLLAGMVLLLARHGGWWPVATLAVVIAEGWRLAARLVARAQRLHYLVGRLPLVVMGMSVAGIIALVPRLASQVALAAGYAAWRWWWMVGAAQSATSGETLPARLGRLLVLQAVLFEAIFLAAATLQPSAWLILALVWGGAFATVYAVFSAWGERAAAVLAATWALVATEVAWVLQLWLFTYATAGGYVLVPQPALILTALAYCFGSIYWAQRQGKLSRGRLTEYLLIGLILIVLVAIGTSWRGSI